MKPVRGYPRRVRWLKGDEQIDLHAFYDEFIRPGRGIANVVAEVEDDAAEADLNKLLSSIEESHDGPGRSR
jgi:predicted Zn-dependent peptidase